MVQEDGVELPRMILPVRSYSNNNNNNKKEKKKREERLHTKYPPPPSVKLQALFVLVYPQTSHKHTSPIAVHLLLNRDHFHHLLQRGDGYFV